MKSFILFFTILLACGNFSFAQDNVNSRNTATERAPNLSGINDNSGNNNLQAWGGRWFGQNAAATSFFTKGFLNATGSHTNFSSGTTSLYGAMEFNNAGVLYCIAVAASSPLQSLDTSTGVLTNLGTITGLGTEQVLGMAFNPVNNTMYLTTTIAGSDKLYTLDLTTRAATLVGSPGQNFFDIAINSTGQAYGVTISDNLYSIDLSTGLATLIGPIGFDANFIQGIGFDRQTDTLWYAAYNNTVQRGELRTVNLTTGATTLIAPFNPLAEVCGFAIPFTSAPPPPVGNTLVLVHDTLAVSTTQRKADRDTLNKYLSGYLSNYTMVGFDTNTVLPDLTNYTTIILQETGFDAAALRYLGAGARNQVKNWLASGTTSNKKSLISIGADQGWNYSRNLSPAQDLVFAETYGKFIYRVDNAPGATSPSVTGVTIDIGNVRNLTSTPPGGSYWPDGCSMVAGGSSVFYKYQNRSALDTLGGIGNVQPGYVVATIFQDPRYYLGGFGEVLKAVVGWVRANGGVITGVNNNVTSVINTPFDYNLSQNYPNPFNPSTKINFSIPKAGVVSLIVYDILGKEVIQLVNEFKAAGKHEINFNASNLSSGTYFYRIEAGEFKSTKKMSLLK
ncbi:MAG TPA: T9SS type A sorting domain-containing protein [Ignavibacteria bacterium]|nr:T9SS type A sorting domain-containing protein [Ignavibacteria bacterium]HRJ99267.1 T9SS type A sorting domain-containing protein [Ignavibacteria bacterium]